MTADHLAKLKRLAILWTPSTLEERTRVRSHIFLWIAALPQWFGGRWVVSDPCAWPHSLSDPMEPHIRGTPNRKAMASHVLLTYWKLWNNERNARVFHNKHTVVACEAKLWVFAGRNIWVESCRESNPVVLFFFLLLLCSNSLINWMGQIFYTCFE